MSSFSRIAGNFSRAAGRYDEHGRLQKEVREHLMEMLPGEFPQGAQVLDAGCGTGRFQETMRLLHPDIKLVSMDIAHGMCRRVPGSAQADIRQLPLADGSIDLLFSSLVVQWVPSLPALFAEWRRVLKPGGSIYLSLFTQGTLHELAESYRICDLPSPVLDFYSPSDVRRAISYSALALKNAETVQHTYYYSSPMALFQEIKAIGAQGSTRGVLTPKQLKLLSQCYETRYGGTRGIPASWHIHYLVLQ